MEVLLLALLVAFILRNDQDPMIRDHFRPTVCTICGLGIHWSKTVWVHDDGHIRLAEPLDHPALP